MVVLAGKTINGKGPLLMVPGAVCGGFSTVSRRNTYV